MRVAFVSTILDYPWGGADALWTPAARAARSRGDALLVAVNQSVAQDEGVALLGAEMLIRRHPTLPRTLGARIARKFKLLAGAHDELAEGLTRFRPELVIISLGSAYDVAGMPSLFKWLKNGGTRFRLIVNFQFERPSVGGAELERARWLYDGAERIFFVSSRNLEVTQRHLGIALQNAAVLHYPLRVRADDVPAWPDEATFSMAAVARLEAIKGIDLLLQALSRELLACPGWRLRVYGRGPDEASLRKLASDLGLAARVEFCGHVQDLHAIWAENHLLVSPALEEGVPMTIPEAMLYGRPAFATDVGGASDWITSNSNGFLCPERSVSSLAGALRQAWEARARWREMGEQAGRDSWARYRQDDYLRVVQP